MLLPSYLDLRGTPIFYSSDITQWGLPEDNGWIGDYLVFNDEETPMVPSFEQEQNLKYDLTQETVKPIHRYCRKTRFRTCLFQLLGKIGFVGKSKTLVEHIISESVGNFEKNYLSPDLTWEYLRDILKKRKMQSFYNRIPAMAKMGGMLTNEYNYTSRQLRNILIDFDIMDKIFPRIKAGLRRKYFPSLRFTCVMLMARNNVKTPIDIPLARTRAKGITLQNDFDEIWNAINEEMSAFIFD